MNDNQLPWYAPEAIAEREATARAEYVTGDLPAAVRMLLGGHCPPSERGVLADLLSARIDQMIAGCEWNGGGGEGEDG